MIFFVELDSEFHSQVKLGDGKIQSAARKGIISIQIKGGNNKLINDVLYVSNLTQNPLSVGQLLQRGFSLFFMKEDAKLLTRRTISLWQVLICHQTKFSSYFSTPKGCCLQE